VTAVQLADWHQVQRRCQQTYPRGARDGVKVDVRRRNSRKNRGFKQPLNKWRTKDEIALALDTRNNLGIRKPDRERRNDEHEAGYRTGDTHIEKLPAPNDWRANPDEGAQRAYQRWRREEVGQTRIDRVVTAGQIVAQLVCEQYGYQRKGERQSRRERPRFAQRHYDVYQVLQQKGPVLVKVILQARADRGGRNHRQSQQQAVQPVAVPDAARRLSRSRVHDELLQLLQLFTRLETDGFSWRNGHLRPSTRIAANTGLARTHVKDAEAAQLDPFTTAKSALHALEHRLDSHLGFRFGDTGSGHNFVNNVEFYQTVLLLDAIKGFGAKSGGYTKSMIGLALGSCQDRPMASIAVEPDLFRKSCARFATGITVASVTGTDGQPYGLTVNSFTSVSCCPPLVLICVDYRCSILPHFRASSHYGINVLSEDQQSFSVRFAARQPALFDGLEWRLGHSGVPLLGGCLSIMECSVSQVVEAGDHAILIGEVEHTEFQDGKPLLYYASSYRQIAE
jgi:flavin reductase (DIM6/NTAB) family NADH-FMN oxidoreductase RutF